MKTITPNQIKCIGALCSKMNIDKETKAVMVAGFSTTGKTSSKDLTYNEAIAMIRHLQDNDADAKKGDKMRNKILHYAHLLGWTKRNKQNTIVADVATVDRWMLEFSYLKKKLYSYKYNELPKLVWQFEEMYKDVTSKM
jgi:phage gp16-like protein